MSDDDVRSLLERRPQPTATGWVWWAAPAAVSTASDPGAVLPADVFGHLSRPDYDGPGYVEYKTRGAALSVLAVAIHRARRGVPTNRTGKDGET